MHPDEDVLDRGQVAIEAKRLEGPCDAEAGDRVGGAPCQISRTPGGCEPNAAGLRAHVAGHHIDECGLAGSVGPDQAKDGAFFDPERHTVDGVHPAKVTSDVSELQQCAHALSTLSTSAAG